MYMIMFISTNVDQAHDVLDIWVKAGASGVTIFESAGMQQVTNQGIRDDVGLIFSLSSMLRAQEIHHRTLISAVKDQQAVDQIVKVTTEYVGDWSRSDVGVLFVWPLAQAFGLDKH